MMPKPFGQAAREAQIGWAATHIPSDALEERRAWVLKRDHQKRNLFSAEWWTHIARKEHRWAHALTSSQCFATNLFAPLHNNNARTRKFLREHQKETAFP
jgi:hypothetical protein